MATTYKLLDAKSKDGNSTLRIRFEATFDNSDLGPNDIDLAAWGAPLYTTPAIIHREYLSTASTDVSEDVFTYTAATATLAHTLLVENSGTAANGVAVYVVEYNNLSKGSLQTKPLSIA